MLNCISSYSARINSASTDSLGTHPYDISSFSFYFTPNLLRTINNNTQLFTDIYSHLHILNPTASLVSTNRPRINYFSAPDASSRTPSSMSANKPSSSCQHPSMFSMTDLNALLSSKLSSLKIIHINACSISKKIDRLELLLQKLNYNIGLICVTETWWNETHSVDIPGYNVAFLGRSGATRGGGVAVYISERLAYSTVDSFTLLKDDFKSLTLEIGNSILNVTYRPPSGNIDAFFHHLNGLLELSSQL